MPTLTLDQLRGLLHIAIGRRGSQKAVAEYLGISTAYLNDVLKGRREPGIKMLKALGYRRIVRYVPAKDDK